MPRNSDDMDRCFRNETSKPGNNSMSDRGDKKRNQSRCAAKCRRATESELYQQLADATLPSIHRPTVTQLGRIDMLRLAVAGCRTRRIGERFLSNQPYSDEEKVPVWQGKKSELSMRNGISMEEYMDGFVIVVNKAGQMLYITSGVADIVGFTQLDLVSRYLRDYVHVDDWTGLREYLCTVNKTNSKKSNEKAFFRMKTSLTPRGGKARKLTMAVYEPLEARIIKPEPDTSIGAFDCFDYDEGIHARYEIDKEIRYIYCTPFDLSSTRRAQSESASVLSSRHDMDMRIRACDDGLVEKMGYKSHKSVIGRSYFEHVHPEDVRTFSEDLKDLYRNTHSKTHYYRLMDRDGGSFWLQTEMLLLVQNIRGSSQKSILCSHNLICESESPVALLHPIPEESYEPMTENVDDNYDNTFDQMNQSKELMENIPMAQCEETIIGDTATHEEVIGSRAPFIPCHMGPLDPMRQEEDLDLPALLPSRWLNDEPSVNEIQNDQVNRQEIVAQSYEIGRISPIRVSSPGTVDLPLDFSDIFGFTLTDTNEFCLEEADRLFSQLDQFTNDDNSKTGDRNELATPNIQPESSSNSDDDLMAVFDQQPVLRKRANSICAPSPVQVTIDETERNRMKDLKTIEFFEKTMMGTPFDPVSPMSQANIVNQFDNNVDVDFNQPIPRKRAQTISTPSSKRGKLEVPTETDSHSDKDTKTIESFEMAMIRNYLETTEHVFPIVKSKEIFPGKQQYENQQTVQSYYKNSITHEMEGIETGSMDDKYYVTI